MKSRTAFPAKVERREGAFWAALCDVPAAEFSDPFVEDTLRRKHVATNTTLLHSVGDSFVANEYSPAGIIFHVSKCGSTLISQSLKCILPVYSQPRAIDDILMPPHSHCKRDIANALRALGLLFHTHAGGAYVLKMASWHVLFSDILRAAFPDTPWIFCIRDPIDVAVSIMEDPDPIVWYKCIGSHDNPFLPYLAVSLSDTASEGEYIAVFYASFCAAITSLEQKLGRIIAYDGLPSVIWNVITPHFNLFPTATQQHLMRTNASHYSKAPHGVSIQFRPDSVQKRQRASREVVAAAESIARPMFNRLLEC